MLAVTITLTPALLATIAEGLQRLEDDRYGDGSRKSVRQEDKDRGQADATRADLARAGIVQEKDEWIPATAVSRGYIRPGVSATLTAKGWYIPGELHQADLAPGTILYFDSECTIPLRNTQGL